MFIKHKHLLGLTAFMLSLGVATVLGGGSAQAATLDVSGGCTLPIAINSVNAGADQAGCTATGPAYATDDTITIPAGTQTLTADLPDISEDVVIQGAGMTQTIVDGDSGQYEVFNVNGASSVSITGMNITAFKYAAIYAVSNEITLDHIEIDGQDAVPYDDNIFGIRLVGPDAGGTSSITGDNVYVHNISADDNFVHGFIVDLGGVSPGAMTISFTNTTISDLHSGGATDYMTNAFMITAGLYQNSAGGSMNSTIVNTTVDNITSNGAATGFGAYSLAGSGKTVNLHTTLSNVTITGIEGVSNFYTPQSPAFFSAGGANDGGLVNSVVEVQNSLMANNMTNGIPSNCFLGDLSSNFGASNGTVNASIISNGNNISDDATCTSFTETGDQQNINNILSTLGPLQDNSGSVPTRALLAGSPAIAAGGAVLGVTTDARGIARANTCPSVGAFEYEGAVCGTATTSPGTSAGGALAPNTGINPVKQTLSILASVLGLGLLAFALRKQQRSN